MKATPRWSSCSATRSLSSTVSDSPSCWDPSRRVVSKMSTASGSTGRSKPWLVAAWVCPPPPAPALRLTTLLRAAPWLRAAPSLDMFEPVLVAVDLAPDGREVGVLYVLGHRAGRTRADRAVVDFA